MMTVQDLQNIINGKQQAASLLNLQSLLQQQFKQLFPSTANVVVAVPDYFRKIGRIVGNTRVETLASYIGWIVVSGMAPHAGPAFTDAYERLESKLLATSINIRAWERCVASTSQAFGFYHRRTLYTDKYFRVDDKRNVETIVRSIVDELSMVLESLDWMDEETRRRAKEKAQSIEYKIAYPEFILSPKLLDEYYQNFSVSNDSFQNKIIRLRTGSS